MITTRDKIAFRIIRFGFKIAMKNKAGCRRMQYELGGDTYAFESYMYKLLKTDDEPQKEG